MKEILDVYDINKIKTEKKHIRGNDNLEKNEYVIVVEIILLNSKKEILLGKRSKNKKQNPLKWETTQGSVKSGEDSKKAAIRELYEELGINISKENLKHIQTIRDDNEHIFKELFLVQIDININDMKFTDGEVIDAKWVDKNEFYNMNNLKELASNMDFNFEKIN